LQPPLEAANSGDWDRVQSLAKDGRHNINVAVRQLSVLFIATVDRNAQMVKILLQAGADPNVRGPGQMTPLIMAASNCNADIVKTLLENGAGSQAKDERGLTASGWAYENNCPHVVKILLPPLTK